MVRRDCSLNPSPPPPDTPKGGGGSRGLKNNGQKRNYTPFFKNCLPLPGPSGLQRDSIFGSPGTPLDGCRPDPAPPPPHGLKWKPGYGSPASCGSPFAPLIRIGPTLQLKPSPQFQTDLLVHHGSRIHHKFKITFKTQVFSYNHSLSNYNIFFIPLLSAQIKFD